MTKMFDNDQIFWCQKCVVTICKWQNFLKIWEFWNLLVNLKQFPRNPNYEYGYAVFPTLSGGFEWVDEFSSSDSSSDSSNICKSLSCKMAWLTKWSAAARKSAFAALILLHFCFRKSSKLWINAAKTTTRNECDSWCGPSTLTVVLLIKPGICSWSSATSSILLFGFWEKTDYVFVSQIKMGRNFCQKSKFKKSEKFVCYFDVYKRQISDFFNFEVC